MTSVLEQLRIVKENANSAEKILKNLRVMLEDRNYTIVEEDEKLIVAKTPTDQMVYVYPQVIQKLNMEAIKAIMHQLDANEIDHAIIIYREITSGVNNIVTTSAKLEKPMELELIEVSNLSYRCISHNLQPTFEKIDDKDVEEIKKKFPGILPKFHATDAVVKYYNWPKGSIIRVIRDSKYEQCIAYRQVV